MASPAVAQPNGIPVPLKSDVDPLNSAVKRKRDDSETAETESQMNGVEHHHQQPSVTNALPPNKATKQLIGDYYQVLKSYDVAAPIFKRPLPNPSSSPSTEPQPKRQKSEDAINTTSITDKVTNDEYSDLESLVLDIKSVVKDHLSELQSSDNKDNFQERDETIRGLKRFESLAQEFFRRETSYPQTSAGPPTQKPINPAEDLPASTGVNLILTVLGEGAKPRPMYSSLPRRMSSPSNPVAKIEPLKLTHLPPAIKTLKALPFSATSSLEKERKPRTLTLGELFPAPRNLPSLQPPKAPKNTTKGVQVGWHHPEMKKKEKPKEKSKDKEKEQYCWFSEELSTGQWLDYSNAAPPSKTMTKQRERAMSLAGNKPSSTDLEISEMESLFRGAFSSFAPSKDDSAAVYSSGMIGQTLWWQRQGQRNLGRLIENEAARVEEIEVEIAGDEKAAEVDDKLIEEAIEKWEEVAVDPSLESICGAPKSKEDREVDDLLQDVSDLIQTLVSYHRNRNLSLPSTSNSSRYAADPSHNDMLTTGSPVQPGEDETATYEALKAQLTLIIQMLPPYAVARLDSDKLGELNVSTKLEIRSDEYHGIMGDDDATIRASQSSTANVRPSAHRASSSSSNMQYGGQYNTSRPSMQNQPYYPAQTPVRAPASTPRAPSTMPNFPQRAPSNAYRAPNGYPTQSYGAQVPKQQQQQQQPFGQAHGQSYGTPQNQRPHQGYGGVPPNTTGQQRYSGYPQNYQSQGYHQAPFQQPHQQPGTPSHAPTYHYSNGPGTMPQRNMSPHVSHQHSQNVGQQGFSGSSTPSRPPSYSQQQNVQGGAARGYFPAGSPTIPNNPTQSQQQPQNQGQQQNPAQQGGFHTAMPPHQYQQVLDQAQARFKAQNQAQKSNEGLRNSFSQQGGMAPAGLGGIGLGRQSIPASVNYNTPSPSPKPNVPATLNVPATNGGPANAAPVATPPTNGNSVPTPSAGAQQQAQSSSV